ncbi:TetR-like C-terminal domain-containing protein [Streptomyces sp. NPDC087534]|uniref:TetR-like C-terminal domain-containing protein n=1 Tax=Streptomyces sp. NPDC087534 TaxID=3365796 RepID=UPI00381EE064
MKHAGAQSQRVTYTTQDACAVRRGSQPPVLRQWARSQRRPDITSPVARAAILIWSRVHGIVSLELTGMFDHQPLEARRLIDLEIEGALQSLRPADANA